METENQTDDNYKKQNDMPKRKPLFDTEVINVYENFWSYFGYIKSIIIGCIIIPIRAVLWISFFIIYCILLFFMIWFLPKGGLIKIYFSQILYNIYDIYVYYR